MTTIEIQMNDVSPKKFWNHCMKACEEAGVSVSVGDYEDWTHPWCVCQDVGDYHDFIRFEPYFYHIHSDDKDNTFTEIIDFNFDSDRKGWGYFFFNTGVA